MNHTPGGPQDDHRRDQPVEGTVVPSGTSPIGFTGAPALATTGPTTGPSTAPVWPHSYWAATPLAPGGAAPTRRRRWMPFALTGAGLVLLVGGGAGGYAIGHANAGGVATSPTGQTGQLVPGTTGQFPGQLDGSTGRFGAPPDLSDGSGGQLDQQDGTTDGTTGGTTDGTTDGTSGGTDDGTTT
ncbi:hypothetical protein OG218_23375 [Kineococcus sp. NBC_00420]|uniref:hypothetical protein n=1 Tax=Kineococcus sp. NBC_00420 TaxID=2903564 RepID=UPI002E1E5BDA